MAKSYTQLKADINSKIRNKVGVNTISKGEHADVETDIVDKVQEVDDKIASIPAIPSGGTNGQVLGKTSGGPAWVDAPSGGTPVTGAASTIVSNNLTAGRVMVTDTNGKVAESSLPSTSLAHLSGVTSNIQTQLNAKASSTQGALATTALQPGQNITTLNNNAGYQTSLQVQNTVNNAVNSVLSITTIEGIFPSTTVNVEDGVQKAVRPVISGPYTGLEGGSTILIEPDDFYSNQITFYYDGAVWEVIRQPISNDDRSIFPNSTPFTPVRDTILIAKAAGTYSNLKTKTGTNAPNLIVNAPDVSPSGIYERVELQFNYANDTWTKVLVEKRKLSAAISASLTSSIKFDADYYLINATLSANTTFTANTSNAIEGGGTLLYLKGNGAATPVFSSELNKVGATNFNNSSNFVNEILFFYTGSMYTYSIRHLGIVVVSDGKIADYDFQQSGNFTDNVASSYLTRNNITVVAGKSGNGVEFGGSGSYLEGNTNGLYNITGPFTYAFWIKPTALGGNMDVFGHWQNESITCYIDNVNAALGFGIYPLSGGFTAADEIKPLNTLTIGTWTHFVITFDGSDMRMYVNSVLSATKGHSAPKSTNWSFLMGSTALFGQLTAVIDSFKVYTRAISQSEVNAIYAA